MDRADATRNVTWSRAPPTPARIVIHVSSTPPPRPHRPLRFADLTELIDAAGGEVPFTRAELAAATAAVVVGAARRAPEAPAADTDRLVGLADVVGLDTLAELWRDSDPVSLPGALWVLYVLRQWCRTRADEVQRLWRAGEPYAPADAVVAGVGTDADAEAIRRLPDAVLVGAYEGDFGVALERAAAFFRVVAAGRRDSVGPTADATDPGRADLAEAELAERNERAATDLAAAAREWRRGTLH